MRVTAVRTERLAAGSATIEELLDQYVPELPERSVVAIASKIVSLCEGRLAPEGLSKAELVHRESDRYLPAAEPYGYQFTITHGTLIPAAGIDESNVGGGRLLWPEDPQRSANLARRHLATRGHELEHVGVVITDSTCMPLRRGTAGICLAHSGFRAINSYIGRADLFGRLLKVSEANVAAGLAAAAVVVMGEGDEQTPLCVIDDLPQVEFTSRDPEPAELDGLFIPPEDDLFGPFLGAVPWQRGEGGR